MMGRMREGVRRAMLGSVLVSLLALPLPLVTAPAVAKPSAPKFDDACKAYREPFTRIKNYSDKTAFTVAAGAMLAGAALAASQGGQVQYRRLPNGQVVAEKKQAGFGDILAGAMLGFVVGLAAGKIAVAKKDRAQKLELINALQQDYSQHDAVFSPLAQNLADLGNCRQTQITGVAGQYKAGTIDKKTADEYLKTIEKWIGEDDRTIDVISQKQNKRIASYAQGLASIDAESEEQFRQTSQMIDTASIKGSEAFRSTVVTQYVDPGSPIPPPPPPPEPQVLTTYYVKDQSGARLRVEPSASGRILRVIPMNTRINAAPSGQGNWYSVEVDGERGYVDASLIGTERVTVTPPPPVASKPRPGAVPIIKVAPQARKPKTILEKQYAAVGAQKTFEDVRAANRKNWLAALEAARNSMLS
jgi:hypothetical protein